MKVLFWLETAPGSRVEWEAEISDAILVGLDDDEQDDVIFEQLDVILDDGAKGFERVDE